MSNKMKGVLKGLRYISQIFEEEGEPEMQIGFPTDVKHVAHIGWDGPAANSPSWIQSFKDGEPGVPPNGHQQNVPRAHDPRLPDQERRCSTGSDSILESPSRRRSDKGKGARRHSSAGNSNDSPERTSASENRTKQPPGVLDSLYRNASTSSKTSRRRKTKTSSKSKPVSTIPDLGYSDPGNGLKTNDTCQSSEKDQNSLDDKARRIPAM